MRVKLLGGFKEIGGNAIVVEDNGTKILLDLGINFDRWKKYYTNFSKPTTANPLAELLFFDLVPGGKELAKNFRKAYCERAGIEQGIDIDAVVVSHAHFDHMYYLHFLDPSIPVVVTPETKLVLEHLQETFYGYTDFTQVKQPEFRRSKYRKNRKIVTTHKVNVGSLSIELFYVDHTIPGSAGVLVEGSKSIAYTGDIRLNGRVPEKTAEFLQVATQADAIILEGTRAGDYEEYSELELEQDLKQYMNSKGLVIFQIPPRDVDRLVTFRNAAEDAGREIVVDPKTKHLLNKLGIFPTMKVYPPVKYYGNIYFNKGIDWQSDYYSWEREILMHALTSRHMVKLTDVLESPQEYAVLIPSYNLRQIVALNGGRKINGIFVHSRTEPYDIEMFLDRTRVKAICEKLGLGIVEAHAHGHINGREIQEISGQSRFVIPVHTKAPEYYAKIIRNEYEL